MQNIANSFAERKPAGRPRSEIGVIAELPLGFDPQQSPIIAAHWFGRQPLGVVAAESVPALALGHKIRQGIATGERPRGAP